MSIYTSITITEEIVRQFKPTRLYVKQINGLKYFGKSCSNNIEKYTGSGVKWLNYVKKYGKENIKTLWISDWFYCPHYLQDFALMYSEYNQIVESDEWANLMPEHGIYGSSKGHMAGIPKPKSETHRKSISDTLTGITLEDRHGKEEADRIKSAMSAAKVGKNKDGTKRKGELNGRARRVRVNGVTFSTVVQAGASVGISDNLLRWYIKNNSKLNNKIWEAYYINDVA
jgi:hypothetical protein